MYFASGLFDHLKSIIREETIEGRKLSYTSEYIIRDRWSRCCAAAPASLSPEARYEGDVGGPLPFVCTVVAGYGLRRGVALVESLELTLARAYSRPPGPCT